jgi:phosphate transport system protein
MQTQQEKELQELKERLLTMGSRAELAVSQAVEALADRDTELAQEVRDADAAIDRLELEIDEMAVRLLSHAPLASDLRMVLVVMRSSQNLERVADEASKVANRARDLAQQPPLAMVVDVPLMARKVLDMLKRVLDAFVQNDVEAAREVIASDKEIDTINKEFSDRLVQLMTEDSSTIERCLHYLTVVKRLERIADHAKNIAEEVVFMCEAQDIRHASKLGGMGAEG